MRLYVHSFRTRALGWITYTFNDEMRFCCVSNHKCMSPNLVNALKDEFIILLQDQVNHLPARASEIAASSV
jgi:hypothetical protein